MGNKLGNSCAKDIWSGKENKTYHLLRELNYMFGSALGNKEYALNMLEKLIVQIQDYCFGQNTKFLLLGPVSRPFSIFENKLSAEISEKFQLFSAERSINYLALIKKKTTNNQSMFFENGIHVSQAGHDEIANMIFSRLNPESH